jgi:glycosyltransferase
MKLTIITACRNAEATIGDCLASVAGQRTSGIRRPGSAPSEGGRLRRGKQVRHGKSAPTDVDVLKPEAGSSPAGSVAGPKSDPDVRKSEACINVEHLILDGASTDGTLKQIEKHVKHVAKVVSEPDRGFYDAINKAIALADGDVIGTLNADDAYADENVLVDVARAFETTGAEAVYGDLVYVSQKDTARVVRHWRSGSYRPGAFRSRGWMPPHPTFFVRREIYERLGGFDLRLTLAADYELMLRLVHRHRIRLAYLPRVLVKMRMGGMTNRSLGEVARKTAEDYRAWRLNRLTPSAWTIFLKNVRKVPQFV